MYIYTYTHICMHTDLLFYIQRERDGWMNEWICLGLGPINESLTGVGGVQILESSLDVPTPIPRVCSVRKLELK